MRYSRRKNLEGIKESSHAGLWLDKYVTSQDKATDTANPRFDLVKSVSQIAEPAEYVHFYRQWESSLKSLGAVTRESQVRGRMIVGLGEESVIETSVTLHHTYGVPYIPGSAIKGMAASFVRNFLGDDWSEESKAYQTVFGTTDDAGYITFFDALYVPKSGRNGKALWPDIITVHHQEYYGNDGKPPADWDSPTPVPFLSATGKYLIALAGSQKWVDRVFEILKYAFEDIGVGAKTSSGYGRLILEAPKLDASKPAGSQAGTGLSGEAKKLLDEIKAISIKDVPSQIKQKYDKMKNPNLTPDEQKEIAKAIIERVKKDWKNGKDKPWFKELEELVKNN